VAIYPLAVGRPIVEYYREMLPVSAWRQLAEGVAAAVLFLCVLFIAWIATDALRPGVYRSRRRWRRRLMLLLPTSLFGAFVEEAIFRGVVLADLLESNLLPTVASVASEAWSSDAAHYVLQVKRTDVSGPRHAGRPALHVVREDGHALATCRAARRRHLRHLGTRPFVHIAASW
jgi:hypothetical protein